MGVHFLIAATAREIGYLHAPLEDADRRADGEGALGVLQAQQVLVAVKLLVDVGVCLEVVALVGAGLNGNAHRRIVLRQRLQAISPQTAHSQSSLCCDQTQHCL